VGTIFGVTTAVPLRVTDPDQLPSVEDAITCVAFVVVIVQVVLLPCATVVGVQVSVAVGAGALTVTVTLAGVVPPAFVALMVYVDVVAGDTVALPVRAVLVVRSGPETESLVAVEPAFHVMTVDCPDVMTPGFAVIVGDGGAITVYVAGAVALPPAPLHVRIYVVVAVGFLVIAPLSDKMSLHPPDAVAEVALAQE
jgi:hypothetical protein